MTHLDFVVCMLAPRRQPLMMPDNVVGKCSLCQRRVQHRPDVPVGIPLACLECQPPRRGDKIYVTPEAFAAWQEYLARQSRH